MPFFEWSEAMSLGEPLLDADHKCLIGLINRLHESLQDGAGSDVLDDIFDGLIAHVEFHFAREAKVMEACGYPDAKAHQEEHAEFTEHIYDLRDRHVRGVGPAINNEALHYLKNWLNHHILIQDMAYKPYLEHNPLGNEVAQAFGPVPADDIRACSTGGHEKTGSHVPAATDTDQGAW